MKHTLAITCTLLTLALLASTAPAAVVDYYVRNSAAGAADGSDWDNAFGTMQDAWNKLPSNTGSTDTFNFYIEKSTGAQVYAGAKKIGEWDLYYEAIPINHYGGLTPTGTTSYDLNAGDVSKVVETDTWAFEVAPGQAYLGACTFSFDDMDITGKGAVRIARGTSIFTLEAERTVFRST